MTFDRAERDLLAQLADELIPASDGFPAASGAGVAQAGLDQVLAVRPDLAAPLKKLLEAGQGREAKLVLEELRAGNAAAFGALSELVAGAYFLNPEVRKLFRYSGQGPKPIDPHPDYQDEGLLQSVIDRGPIFRPTPEAEASA